jgi:DNA/RNA endonuclease YhcR with UshA esterase domain
VKPSHSSLVVQPSRLSLLVWMLLCLIVALALATLILEPALAQNKLTAAEAKDHVGETATVCGSVASTHYAASTKGQATFLNLDKSYPNQIFTILIWGSNRSKFGTPETDYKGKRICVTGKIAEYRGVPEIVADHPKQIRIGAEK